MIADHERKTGVDAIKTVGRLFLLLYAVAFLLIATVSCSETGEADIPRYSNKQVEYIAQRYIAGTPMQYDGQCNKVAWLAEYLGEGVWMVGAYCIDSWGYPQRQLDAWYFHESNGQLTETPYQKASITH
jgi:hypothetical protein